jgi:hypothetical protein
MLLVGLRKLRQRGHLLAVFPVAYLAYMCSGQYYFLRFLCPCCRSPRSPGLWRGFVRLCSRPDAGRTAVLIAATVVAGWQSARASVGSMPSSP